MDDNIQPYIYLVRVSSIWQITNLDYYSVATLLKVKVSHDYLEEALDLLNSSRDIHDDIENMRKEILEWD